MKNALRMMFGLAAACMLIFTVGCSSDDSGSGSDGSGLKPATGTGSVSFEVTVDGKYKCPGCGHAYDTKAEAENCGLTEACPKYEYTVIFADSEVTGHTKQDNVTQKVAKGTKLSANQIPVWTSVGYDLTWTNPDSLTVDSVITKNTTFTAAWKKYFTVKFVDSAAGDIAKADDVGQKVYENGKATLPAFATKTTDYDLTWNSSVAGLTPDAVITADVVFTAIWTAHNQFTVRFIDTAAASDADKNETVTVKVFAGKTATAPSWTKENYTLSWSGDTSAAISADTDFTAKWTEKPKCSHCGTHYDTQEQADNCSKQEGCPMYGKSITVTFSADAKSKAVASNTAIVTALTGNIKNNNGEAVTYTYNGVTYNAGVKMESSTSMTLAVSNGSKLTFITDGTSTSKGIKINGTQVKGNAQGVVSYTAASTSLVITKDDTRNLFAIIIEN